MAFTSQNTKFLLHDSRPYIFLEQKVRDLSNFVPGAINVSLDYSNWAYISESFINISFLTLRLWTLFIGTTQLYAFWLLILSQQLLLKYFSPLTRPPEIWNCKKFYRCINFINLMRGPDDNRLPKYINPLRIYYQGFNWGFQELTQYICHNLISPLTLFLYIYFL